MPDQPQSPLPVPERSPGTRIILLVEDDPALAEIHRWTLAKAGFEVLQAADGMTALALARERRPDLILSDVMLPKMDGFKLCRLLKFDTDLKRIPFLFLTGKSQEKDRETGLGAGADAYSVKPISAADLLALIRKHLP